MKRFSDKYFGWLKDKDQSWSHFIVEILFLIALVLFVRFYVFQFFRVSGPSMCPTLNQFEAGCKYDKGEFIFVNEFIYNFIHGPEQGDIVVFSPPNDGKKKYIKRIMAIPGETIRVEEGIVYRKDDQGNSEKLEEVYLSDKNRGNTYASLEEFEVPDGHYLLFGDNRNQSLDSRRCFSNNGCNQHNTPFVKKSEIIGKAQYVVFPFTRARKLFHESQ